MSDVFEFTVEAAPVVAVFQDDAPAAPVVAEPLEDSFTQTVATVKPLDMDGEVHQYAYDETTMTITVNGHDLHAAGSYDETIDYYASVGGSIEDYVAIVFEQFHS